MPLRSQKRRAARAARALAKDQRAREVFQAAYDKVFVLPTDEHLPMAPQLATAKSEFEVEEGEALLPPEEKKVRVP